MSEYELFDTFISYVEAVMAFMMAFVSVTSAFLLATYTSAKKLSPSLAKLIVALYSISSVYLLMGAQRTSVVISDVRSQMREQMIRHAAAYEPQMILPIFNLLLVIFMSSLFIGALWYCYKERNDSEHAD